MVHSLAPASLVHPAKPFTRRMIFERTPRRAVPRLLGYAGRALKPNGETLLSLRHAARVYHISVEDLAADWRATYRGIAEGRP